MARIFLNQVRRLVLILTLMYWQGGFMFYGSVVVPVGARVLGSHRDQGFITRSVTNYLNVAGAIALAVWGWNLFLDRAETSRKFMLSWFLWGGLVVMIGLQFWLHNWMDELLDPYQYRILDRELFRSLHSAYLMLSTLQWLGATILLGITLRRWQN